MVFPTFNRFRKILFRASFSGVFFPGSPVCGAEGPQDGLLRSLQTINSIAVGESAGSHGTLGLSLGAGASYHTLGDMDPNLRKRLGFGDGVAQKLVMPRIWLSKGLPIPVDFGISVGASQEPILQQGMGYLQWTLLEGVGLPSIATRFTHSRLFMAQSTNLNANQASLAVSWTFLRYVTIFGGSGLVKHSGDTNMDLFAADGGLSIAAGREEDATYRQPTSTSSTWTERTSSIGMRLVLIPPFVSITAEMIRRGDALQSAMAKMAIGL